MIAEELRRRERLGIPADAAKALIFAEASHWDPNWLFTSHEYYRLAIRRALDRALDELAKNPRRIYSVECIFFLKMYWDRRPEQRDAIRRLVNEGRIRLYGCGVTTPDVILPSTEALLRDYLIGQEWLRHNGMTQETRTAYFPDDFGMGAGLPTVLRALGVDYCAITRIDGMHFAGSDYRPASWYPPAGSSAELLQKIHRTLDFVWRGPDGAETLCHWNAFTYGQGDLLDMIGPWKWMGAPAGIPWRTPEHIARRIRGYVRQLAPLSRTPYLFCPIGFDFTAPIRGLVELLDRYNQLDYPRTGVWATLAGFDDYLALVDCRRAELPTLTMDPNPYFMGFYATRPEMKQRCRRLGQKLLLAEKLSLAAEARAGRDAVASWRRELQPAWDIAAVANHHDYITGCAPDRVWRKEQRPWLLEAEATVDRTLEKITAACPPPPRGPAPTAPRWSLVDGRLIVENDFFELRFDGVRGGCLTRWFDRVAGRELLTGLGADLALYEDSGGLWRMGCEFRGGKWRELETAGAAPAAIRVNESTGALVVEIETTLDGEPMLRRVWLRADSPVVRLQVAGTLALRRALTLRFAFDVKPKALRMDVPGGVIDRPLHKIFTPTFWAAQHFAHVGAADAPGVAVAFFAPASIAADERGGVEWVAMRNAPREQAFGFLPLAAHPARGTVPEEQRLDCAVWPTTAADRRDFDLAARAAQVLRPSWIGSPQPDWAALAETLVRVEGRPAHVAALKRADRGDGWIVRLLAFGSPPGESRLTVPGRRIVAAWRCDARERDQQPLPVADGAVLIAGGAEIDAIRLNFGR